MTTSRSMSFRLMANSSWTKHPWIQPQRISPAKKKKKKKKTATFWISRLKVESHRAWTKPQMRRVLRILQIGEEGTPSALFMCLVLSRTTHACICSCTVVRIPKLTIVRWWTKYIKRMEVPLKFDITMSRSVPIQVLLHLHCVQYVPSSLSRKSHVW